MVTTTTREKAEAVARRLSAIPSLPTPSGVTVLSDDGWVLLRVPLAADVVAWANYFGVAFHDTGIGSVVCRFIFEGVDVSVSAAKA